MPVDRQTFDAIRQRVIDTAPPGLSREQFDALLDSEVGKVDAKPAPVEEQDQNTVGTLLKHFWDGTGGAALGMGQLLPFPKEWGGAGWDAPLKALKSHTAAAERVRAEAADAFTRGDYATGIRKSADWLASAITMGGSVAMDRASDEAQQGKYAAALGDTTALAATMVAPEAAAAVRTSAPARAVADAAQSAAERRVVKTIAPTIGPNKTRFANQAAKGAPQVVEDIVREGAPMSREGLHDMMRGKLSEAEEALDAAAAQRDPSQRINTQPIAAALRQKRAALTADMPGRATVEPGPNAARIKQIDQALNELRQLGPQANYQSLLTIRRAYDGPAKAVYSPAVTADYMTAQGSKLGAADVTGVLRDSLAGMDPTTAAANAQYSIYRSINDVLDATAEVERARPTVGRSIMASGVGAMAGEAAGAMFGQQGMGATVGAVLGPLVERGMNTRVAPALRMIVTKQLGQLAEAIRSGNPTAVETSLKVLRPMVFSLSGERGIPTPAVAGAVGTSGREQR